MSIKHPSTVPLRVPLPITPLAQRWRSRQPSPALAKSPASIKLLEPPATYTALTVAQISQWMKNAVTLDWDSVNANRPAWNARWNKNVER